MWIRIQTSALAAALAVLLLPGCGSAPETPEDNPEPAAAPEAAAPEPKSLTDIFPEGLGRPLVINSCGSCHAVACSAIGQRTLGRWKALESDHRDRVADMSDEEYMVLFAYLGENFSDAKPEPRIPPQFLEGGCTPF